MTRSCDGIRLQGGKSFRPAAGFATRALVTAVDDAGHTRMLVIPLVRRTPPPAAARAPPRPARRKAVTGLALDLQRVPKPGPHTRRAERRRKATPSAAAALAAGATAGAARRDGRIAQPDRHGNRAVANSRKTRAISIISSVSAMP